MNKKRIAEHLKSKFNEWADSIEDAEVRNLVKRNSIITGGSIVSLLTDEKVNDYDVYFTTQATAYVVARYYVDIFNKENAGKKNRFGYLHKAMVIMGGSKESIQEQIEKQGERDWKTAMLDIPEGRVKIVVRSDGVAEDKNLNNVDEDGFLVPDPEQILTDMDDIDYESDGPPFPPKAEKERKKYQPKFLTSNAISLTDKIQCIIRFYGTAEEIHKNYDFIHCTNYWESFKNKLFLSTEALESILDKRLVYQGSLYPLSSVIRIRKFLARGWKINAGQVLKMCFQLSELDLSDPHVLEDQLIGVDTMYFRDLIDNLKEMREGVTEAQVDSNYIATLVDKIFG